MAQASAVICGLCRDVASHLPATIARVERLAGMFRTSSVVIFESDSIDQTPEILRQWSQASSGVTIISERLGQPRLRGTHRQRTEHMAYYRNRCRERVLADFGGHSFVLVVDMDLAGGWSFDGVANSFGHDDWDFIGSNGLSFASLGDEESYEYADAFAHRAVGQARLSAAASHALRVRRGEPLAPIWSCFGGLGIYRMASYRAASYAGDDCEHVTFHQALRQRGFNRLFLNPSQIVVYSPWSHPQ